MNEDTERVRSIVETALERHRYGVVATAAEGRPNAALMAFAAVAQGRELVLASHRDTRKYADLEANPSVAIAIEHEQRQPPRAPKRVGVTAMGSVDMVTGGEIIGARNAFLRRNPDLAGFVVEADCVLLRVRVKGYQVAEGIHTVTWVLAPARVGDREPSP
jgi:uncharacterized protein YhbP (UPF0306 family)